MSQTDVKANGEKTTQKEENNKEQKIESNEESKLKEQKNPDVQTKTFQVKRGNAAVEVEMVKVQPKQSPAKRVKIDRSRLGLKNTEHPPPAHQEKK